MIYDLDAEYVGYAYAWDWKYGTEEERRVCIYRIDPRKEATLRNKPQFNIFELLAYTYEVIKFTTIVLPVTK